MEGAGLGLRRDLMRTLREQLPEGLGFMEVAPENWINVGGKLGERFRYFTDNYPFVCHGLSLSIGSPAPLDEQFVGQVKAFLDDHQVKIYSEHLSYCGDDGHMYDLLPIPFTEEAVHYVAKRIRRVQDILERQIAVENVSAYATPGKQMEEIDFINAVLEEADCLLLLDVNNIYVNSINHGYDAKDFLSRLPGERIAYSHIAGHYDEAPDLLIDTHGAAVKEDVWDLLDEAYRLYGVFPTLLERDFNFPPMAELMAEVGRITSLQEKWRAMESADRVAITA